MRIGKEAGITDVLRSFNKMAVYNEPHSKSSESNQNEPKVHTESYVQHSKSSKSNQTEPKVYTGSHDQFAPEPVKEGGSVKDYLVEKLKPSDEDKVVSDVITQVFHRNDLPVQEVTSTSIYGGEGRSLQESGN